MRITRNCHHNWLWNVLMISSMFRTILYHVLHQDPTWTTTTIAQALAPTLYPLIYSTNWPLCHYPSIHYKFLSFQMYYLLVSSARNISTLLLHKYLLSSYYLTSWSKHFPLRKVLHYMLNINKLFQRSSLFNLFLFCWF